MSKHCDSQNEKQEHERTTKTNGKKQSGGNGWQTVSRKKKWTSSSSSTKDECVESLETGWAVSKSEEQQTNLVWIPDTVWDKKFDPIDREIYYILKRMYPRMMPAPDVLAILKYIEPYENQEYVLADVLDSYEHCLGPYIVRDAEGNVQLKEQ